MKSEYSDIISFIRGIYHKPEGAINLHEPVFMGNEIKYVNDCIASTFVSSIGEYVNAFETKIAEYTQSGHAVAAVNGTAALHIALKLAGVRDGDEVVTQPLTFIATSNAITYCNANPVFIDVDKDTMGLSSEKLDYFLKKSTRFNRKTGRYINKVTLRPVSAILPMHTFGNPCRVDEIVELGDKYSIPVVEDAAESIGSLYKERHTGTFGKIGILSFNGNKIITTGGGGIILTKDEQIARLAKHITTQAKISHPWEFSHDQIGYNYRMPNINAALGVAQLEMLDEFIKNKRITGALYKEFFQNHKIKYFVEPEYSRSNCWLNAIIMESKEERDLFLKATNSSGIMTRPIWTLMTELPMYSDCYREDLTNAIELQNTVINLPSGYRKEA